MLRLSLLLAIFFVLMPSAMADDEPRLRFPVACDLGATCWLMNLADTATEKDKAQDFTCGPRTYDGHDGTDIAIQGLEAMTAGVDVLAAADGKVLRLRDGETDEFRSEDDKEKVRSNGRECGNGLIIDHGGDWTTQYCHLKKGSFKLKTGDAVKAGQAIAQIGLSGISDHPHVHMTVRHKGQILDPFTGRPVTQACAPGGQALWAERVSAEGFNLYDAGFTTVPPDFDAISHGKKPSLPDKTAKTLIFWFGYFGARAGDRVDITIRTPSGMVLADTQTRQEKDRARQYLFAGKDLRFGLPEKGVYTGEARVTRISATGETRTELIHRDLDLK